MAMESATNWAYCSWVWPAPPTGWENLALSAPNVAPPPVGPWAAGTVALARCRKTGWTRLVLLISVTEGPSIMRGCSRKTGARRPRR
ncbi:hypothetical protein D3C72_537520 [compost metagenome]